MRMLPLVRKYHPSIVDTDLDIYKIKNRVAAAPISPNPDPFQVTDKLGANKINDAKTRIVVYNSRGLFYFI